MDEISAAIITTPISPVGHTGNVMVMLGSWCLSHPEIPPQEGISIEIVPYHWDDRQIIPLDLARIKREYEYLLPQLADRLNAIHGTSYSLRFWRILVGWWLYWFLQVLFDRWTVLEDAAERYPAATLSRLPDQDPNFASPDMKRFIQATISDEWNERLWADLAAEWTTLQVIREDPTFDCRNTGAAGKNTVAEPTSSSLKRAVVKAWNSTASFLAGDSNRVVIYGEYVSSFATRFKLASKFRCLPIVVNPLAPVQLTVTNPELRKMHLSGTDDSYYSRIASELVGRFIPTCYLENFADLQARAARLPLPKSPKVAFTANSFSADDVWKAWAALATEGGTKLVIGQHGGGYGSCEWMTTLEHEIAISDRYLTWGWSDSNNPKVVPSVAGKLIGVKKARKSGKSCLLLSTSLPQYSYHLNSGPIASQYEKFLSNQFELAGMLDPEIQANLTIRPGAPDFGRNLKARWLGAYPDAIVSTDSSNYWSDVRSAKVCIAVYNGTAPIEILATGQPMVWYLDPSLHELAPRFDEMASQMLSAKILFLDKEECALHVNSIWADVYQWWSDPSVQTVVNNFLLSYGNTGRRPISRLARAIAQIE
jgi:putative transferase (TIGR04331 family)